MIGYLKVQTYILLSKKLNKYRKDVRLNARLPNFSVKMGFGLHVGWGIEVLFNSFIPLY